jgi:acyl-CoA synthetase (AMP-forming)/AMP-acid ligase II
MISLTKGQQSAGTMAHVTHGVEKEKVTDSLHQQVSPAVLQAHCREVAGLSPYKLPRIILATEQGRGLPVNSNGKVLKQVVKQALVAAGAGGSMGGGELARSRL